MLNKIALALSMQLVKSQSIDAEDQEIACYGIFLLLADFIQIFVLFSLSLWLQMVVPVTLFCSFFCSLKRYIGGWHAMSHLSCLFIFTALALTASYLGQYASPIISLGCSFTAFYIVFKLAPIAHPNNPKSAEQLARFRKKSRTAAVIHLIVITFLSLNQIPYHGCAALGSLAAASTLVLGRRYRNEGSRHISL